MIYLFLTILLIVILCFGILDFLVKYIEIHKKYSIEKIKTFETFLTILSYHMEKAYEIIHKEKILIYSLEGMKLSDDQFNECSKDYTKLTLKMLGPNLKEILSEFYGDEQTLIYNIMEYFNYKYERDEIYKSTAENMMNGFNKFNENVNIPLYNKEVENQPLHKKIALNQDQLKSFGL